MNIIYHTKQVTIAGETITAEYFENEFSLRSPKNRTSDLWYIITLPFFRLKIKVIAFYWDIRYGIQRMFKGYDNVDTFSLCYKFMDRYYKILTEYKKNMRGYPGRITEEEWKDIIDKMIFHLYYMDDDRIDEELMKDVPDSWIPTWKTTGEIMEYHKTEFFKLFSEYFYDL